MGAGRERSEPQGVRAAHRPSRRAAIIAAAIEELGGTDAAGTVSVARIVARSAMSPSAFYYHFTSVDELLAVVVDELFSGLEHRFAAQRGEDDPGEWAVAAVHRQVAWIRARPAEARLVVAFAYGSPGGPDVVAAVRGRLGDTAAVVGRTITARTPDRGGSADPALEAAVVGRALVGLVVEAAALASELPPAAPPDPDALAAAAEVAARRLVVTAPR